ncbi:MAG: hypothetical protein N838_19160 [Thiohalocapsa sp. PB-PSB1]|jgi:hypothetical protein|nr:MAG: hypothetical protein N838_19160 [Thiohalocapsa sp. PB-PSB1]
MSYCDELLDHWAAPTIAGETGFGWSLINAFSQLQALDLA